MIWEEACDIYKRIQVLKSRLDLPWVDLTRVFAYRSFNTSTRAYARIWGLPRIFQLALDIKSAYVIEVISEKFDGLPTYEQDKVLIHELVHIPKSFSGSLAPHKRRRRGIPGFEDRVRALTSQYENNTS